MAAQKRTQISSKEGGKRSPSAGQEASTKGASGTQLPKLVLRTCAWVEISKPKGDKNQQGRGLSGNC